MLLSPKGSHLPGNTLRLGHRRRPLFLILISLCLWLSFPWQLHRRESAVPPPTSPNSPSDTAAEAVPESSPFPTQKLPKQNQTLHLLVAATQADPNLCKSLYSASALDYPIPTVLAWQHEDNPKNIVDLWANGTHMLKISATLRWLERLPRGHEDDLVLMMDGYDSWFQLPQDVLIERYHRINEEANQRIRRRLGRAADIEGIKQTIIFGAEKKCAPNQLHTMACWPLPPSPLPEDMYGINTDKALWAFPDTAATIRPRFLNSGVIMGPVRDMRRMFQQASKKVVRLRNRPEQDDDGSGWSSKMYHGSDQAAFNMVLGEQEYAREVLRIRHLSWWHTPYLKAQQFFGRDLSDTDVTLQGNPVGNILNPPWSHSSTKHVAAAGRRLEFGIGLDYWSLLAFQTSSSFRDGRWLQYDSNLTSQISSQRPERTDCVPRLQALSPDILNARRPLLPDDIRNGTNWTSLLSNDDLLGRPIDSPWLKVPLFSNVCLGTVPAIVHLNGNKTQRDTDWKELWFVTAESNNTNQQARAVRDPRFGQGGQNGESVAKATDPTDQKPQQEVPAKKEEVQALSHVGRQSQGSTSQSSTTPPAPRDATEVEVSQGEAAGPVVDVTDDVQPGKAKARRSFEERDTTPPSHLLSANSIKKEQEEQEKQRQQKEQEDIERQRKEKEQEEQEMRRKEREKAMMKPLTVYEPGSLPAGRAVADTGEILDFIGICRDWSLAG